jgi:hypothetical protein
MLVLEKLTSKSWYLTLTEKVTISNPYFLFVFTNRTTSVETSIILTDISTHIERYNQFDVTEGTTFTLDAGEYEYQVYAQTSSINTDPSLANELVESGVLKVVFTPTAATNYEVTLNEKIYEIEAPEQILFMLLEDGSFLLQENEDKIIL